MTPFFLGQQAYAIDAQRRVPLRKEWRTDADAFVLVPGRAGVIQAMSESFFRQSIVDSAASMSIADREKSQALMVMGSKAVHAPVDKQGRIKLSPELMEHAGIRDQAVLVGAVTTIQIMSPETWETNNTDMDTALDQYDRVH